MSAVTSPVRHDGIDAMLADARSRLDRIDVETAYRETLDGAFLVDIRPAAQRAAEGEVSPALHPMVIERNVLEWRFDPRSEARLPEASYDARILVLCQEGYTSSLAADALRSLGPRRDRRRGWLQGVARGAPADRLPPRPVLSVPGRRGSAGNAAAGQYRQTTMTYPRLAFALVLSVTALSACGNERRHPRRRSRGVRLAVLVLPRPPTPGAGRRGPHQRARDRARRR